MCQLKEVSHTRGDSEEVKEERKKDLRKKMREFITHFTERYTEVNCHLNCTKKKITCQQAIRTLSVNLICIKLTNMCQQTMTIIQQSFQTLKTQP